MHGGCYHIILILITGILTRYRGKIEVVQDFADFWNCAVSCGFDHVVLSHTSASVRITVLKLLENSAGKGK